MPKAKQPVRPLTVTIDETMKTIGCSRSTVYALMRQGKIRSAKIGSRTVLNYGDVEAVVADAFKPKAAPSDSASPGA